MSVRLLNLEKKLDMAEQKVILLENKKNEVVNKQFKMEDDNKTHLAAYSKLIEKDFDLADKIEEQKRIIKNLKQSICRAKNKASK